MTIEILYRGYSHITMYLLGGFCFVIVGLVNNKFKWRTPIFKQMLIATVIITIAELFAGIILNGFLGLNIWDYSYMPFNLLGQICLTYMFLWFLLSAPAIILDDVLRWQFFGEDKPHYYLI